MPSYPARNISYICPFLLVPFSYESDKRKRQEAHARGINRFSASVTVVPIEEAAMLEAGGISAKRLGRS